MMTICFYIQVTRFKGVIIAFSRKILWDHQCLIDNKDGMDNVGRILVHIFLEFTFNYDKNKLVEHLFD